MIFSMTVCHACRKPVTLEGKIKRTEVCPACGSDLHACLNCSFYDATVHNRCRETQAEWVANKEKANFCDYFVFADRSGPTGGPAASAAGGSAAARKKLDDLFKKA
jgi:hypothetical protein